MEQPKSDGDPTQNGSDDVMHDEEIDDLEAARATTTPTKEQTDTLWSLLVAGFVANVMLLIGGAMFLAFYIRESRIPWLTRDVTGDALYLVGFAAFLVSGLLEGYTDFCYQRQFGHGRYTTKRRVNLLISCLFLVAIAGDFVAFLFWRQGSRGLREEHLTQWVVGHLWLFTAILVLITNRPKYVPFQNRMDSVANFFFLCEAAMVCLARYVSEVGDITQNVAEDRAEIAASVFWVLNAIFYLIADTIRLRNPDDLLVVYDG